MQKEIIHTASSEVTARIFGVCDAYAKEIENAFGVNIENRTTSSPLLIS